MPFTMAVRRASIISARKPTSTRTTYPFHPNAFLARHTYVGSGQWRRGEFGPSGRTPAARRGSVYYIMAIVAMPTFERAAVFFTSGSMQASSPGPSPMLDRYLLFWLILSSAAAYAWPDLAGLLPVSATSTIDPFLALGAGRRLDLWIVATMFAIGSMLPREELQAVARRWPRVLAGVCVQYSAMPLLALLFASLLVPDGDAFLGVVLVGCVPGAMASNVLTLKARGNTSYSVSLTTVATLLSPLAVPLAIFITLRAWAGEQIGILGQSSLYMTAVVVIPVLVGHALQRTLGFDRPQWQRAARAIANISILVIIAVVVARNRRQFHDFEPSMLAALIGINVGGYLAGTLAGLALRLDDAMRRALTLEVGMQNAGLGVSLALFLYPERSAIAIAPALYTFGCMLTGTALAQWWSARAPQTSGQCPSTIKG